MIIQANALIALPGIRDASLKLNLEYIVVVPKNSPGKSKGEGKDINSSSLLLTLTDQL